MSAGQVGTASFPADLKLPRYPVPVFRIGRLAVDHRARGADLGAGLKRFALHLALDLAGRVGIHAVVVDAKDETASTFYRRHGFIPFQDAPLSLFLPISSLRAAAAG